jgi:hypothetical protein
MMYMCVCVFTWMSVDVWFLGREMRAVYGVHACVCLHGFKLTCGFLAEHCELYVVYMCMCLFICSKSF